MSHSEEELASAVAVEILMTLRVVEGGGGWGGVGEVRRIRRRRMK